MNNINYCRSQIAIQTVAQIVAVVLTVAYSVVRRIIECEGQLGGGQLGGGYWLEVIGFQGTQSTIDLSLCLSRTSSLLIYNFSH
jgi:hypothetical protein